MTTNKMTIDFKNHRIKFFCKYAKEKNVLDIGCVQHDPDNYALPEWVHKALKVVAKTVIGLDYYAAGVTKLKSLGYNVICADAQNFQLNEKFDVIVAGDLIEHLDNISGFLECCKSHLRPDGLLLITTPNPWYWQNILAAAAYGIYGKVKLVNKEHACWLCPQTLSQTVARHGLIVTKIEFGSQKFYNRLLPLPRMIKHTTFHAVVRRDPGAAK